MELSVSEQAIINFYEFDYKGRGYYHFPFCVGLEAPFVPFSHIKNLASYTVDDGKVPSLLHQFIKLLQPKEKESVEEGKELKPNIVHTRPELIALELSFPKRPYIDKNLFVEFLNMLSFSENTISFEIIGTFEKITIQIVCSLDDKMRIQSQCRAYFPTILFKETRPLELPFNEYDDILLCDFGLEDEFVRPIYIPQNFSMDTLTSVFATLEILEQGDVVVYQTLFKGVVNPWSQSMLYAVSDNQGNSFFSDAPEMPQLAKNKVSKPLFAVVLRLAVQSIQKERGRYLATNIIQSTSTFSQSEYNKLIPLSNEGYKYQHHVENLFYRQTNRLGMILNTDELVSLVHYPNDTIHSVKLGFNEIKTKKLPNTCIHQKYILGINEHNNIQTPVSIDDESRLRHTHIIGATGVGKSTLIANMMLEDMKHGNGCALFDPHGDIVEDILLRIPEHRKNDVIIIDPSDSDFPIGFNLLAATTDTEKIVLSSDLVSAFKRHATAWGDNMTAVLSNAINTFLESTKGGTLIELKRFLLEEKYRKEFLTSVEDSAIHYYWEHEYYMVKKGIAPLLTRIDTFLRPKIVRYMLAQKSGIDFRTCIDEKKIVLIKLSQGLIGEDNSYLLGSLFLSKFNQVIRGRQSLSKKERHPYYIYLDEFQNFITPSITSILSGARKYGLGLILAHQELAQIDDTKILNSVISNPHTRICFRLGDSDAKRLEAGFSYFEQNDLQSLGIGEAVMRVGSSNNDFNIITERLPKLQDDAETIKKHIIQNTRNCFAKPKEEIRELLGSLLPKVSVKEKTRQKSKKAKNNLESINTESLTQENKHKDNDNNNVVPEIIKQELREQAEKSKINKEHNYLQTTIKKLGQDKGFLSTIEKETSNGGRVDVVLERDGFKIACEISVTNKIAYELKNIQKCIADNFDIILMISKNKKHLNNIKDLTQKSLAKSDLKRIFFIQPESISEFLNITKKPLKPKTEIIKGFRVVTEYSTDEHSSVKNMRANIARILSKK